MALEARARAAGCRHGIARLRATVMSACTFCSLLRLLCLLLSLAQLVEVLAKRRVSLHALADDMMTLRLVVGSPLMALGRRL